MFRPNLKNRTFEWMGEKPAPIINPNHFLGHSPFDFRWHKKAPPVNLKKENELYVLEIAVPGFTKDELEVRVRDNVLIVEGKKHISRRTPQSLFVLKEFDWDSFERRFELAGNIGHEDIKATCENGVLRLTFVDVPEEQEEKFKSIEVT